LADDLAEKLDLLGYDPLKSATRRYKHQMHEVIWGRDGPAMIEAGARLPGAGLPMYPLPLPLQQL
jgi:hypothetical protein